MDRRGRWSLLSVSDYRNGGAALDFEVRRWATSDDYLGMLHDVRIAVYNTLNEAGIEIPFDQIVVHQA